jgi:hypothetical protein
MSPSQQLKRWDIEWYQRPFNILKMKIKCHVCGKILNNDGRTGSSALAAKENSPRHPLCYNLPPSKKSY